MYKKILIATDGSELSGKGVEAGFDLARRSGAEVVVLTVSESFPTYDLGTRLGLFRDQEAVDRYDAACREAAEAILAAAAAAAGGVACETLHLPDRAPAAAILETARARSCDLIVITSHGRHGLERFILGSQAARVVQGAEVSVLVVR